MIRNLFKIIWAAIKIVLNVSFYALIVLIFAAGIVTWYGFIVEFLVPLVVSLIEYTEPYLKMMI